MRPLTRTGQTASITEFLWSRLAEGTILDGANVSEDSDREELQDGDRTADIASSTKNASQALSMMAQMFKAHISNSPHGSKPGAWSSPMDT